MDRISFRMSRPYVVFSALVCLLGFISFFLTRSSTPSPLPLISNHAESFSLAAFYTKVPYTSSWASWWHPQRSHGRGSSEFGRGWNLLYHLGGNGPWIEKVDGTVKGGIGVPEGCRVEQVHMVGIRTSFYFTHNVVRQGLPWAISLLLAVLQLALLILSLT